MSYLLLFSLINVLFYLVTVIGSFIGMKWHIWPPLWVPITIYISMQFIGAVIWKRYSGEIKKIVG